MNVLTEDTTEELLAKLRQMQSDEDLRDRHLVFINRDGFVIAHTDHERALADAGGRDLEDCRIHRWLARTNPSTTTGIYRVVRRLGDDEQPFSLERAKVHV